MQIILVSRSRKVPKTFDLAQRRLRWHLTGLAMAAVVGCGVLGAAVALTVSSPRDRALAEIRQLKQQIHEQDTQLAGVRKDSPRELAALAITLGQLAAQ